jgi:environmental stress-induced protein Ves
MSALQQVPLAGVAPTPWKNGGGLTRDLLLWPPGPAAAWQLRISVAEVAQSGPFSAYPGVARWFCVLQGAGVVLRFSEGPHLQTTLTPDSPPLHFDGALAPGCELVDGPTLDLNLMAQQHAGRAEMGRAVAGVPWVSRAPLRAVFTLHGATLLREGQPPVPLAAGTLAFVGVDAQPSAGEAWELAQPGDSGWWLGFEPHAR